ncbi:hypothetical protein [Streptomyces sp. NPDC058486]|uniref:hypothetical protein n=1 Tax=unclassified Streptomyces TaxID=2593676 RepID=UPI00366642B3
MAVAAAYLQASGYPVSVNSEDAVALVGQALAGNADVRRIAASLKTWSLPR